jgi:DNA-binding transcriptional LysR family regulator
MSKSGQEDAEMAGSRGVDANLLVALQALLRERSVTRAAEAVHMSQPAMSAALRRLRQHYDDALLTRTGRTYELTPVAVELFGQVEETLGAVAVALDPWAHFSAATSTRRFRITGSDYAIAVIVEPLMAIVGQEAPGVTVDFDPLPPPGSDLLAQLLRRDVIIGAMGYGVPGHRQVVFADRFLCIVAEDNARLRDGQLTIEDLSILPHAVASFGGSGVTPADQMLTDAGVRRRVDVTVEGLLTLPFAVSGTDLCAFVPERMLARCPHSLRLTVADVPFDDPEIVEAAHWHPTRDDDPSVRWLRRILAEVSLVLKGQAPGISGRPH